MQNHQVHDTLYTDGDVIDLVLKGNLPLFEILVRRYNPVLYKIARSYGFNHQDAEDLMQDTHVSAYTHLQNFENRASYKTWISRIMINRCLYQLKYGYFKNEVPSCAIPDQNIEPMFSKKKENSTEDVIANRELAIVLERSLMNIPVIYRMVFVLRVAEDLSIEETATSLGITTTNVKVRLNRAKALLQKQIEEFYTHTDIFSFNLIFCDALVKRVLDNIQAIDKKDKGS